MEGLASYRNGWEWAAEGIYPARAHARARKATSYTSPLVTPPHAATDAARCESCHMKAVTLMVSNRLTTTWKGHNPCHT